MQHANNNKEIQEGGGQQLASQSQRSSLEDIIIQSILENEDNHSKQSINSKLVIVPPATVYSFIVQNDEDGNYYLKLAQSLRWLSLFFFLFGGIFFIFSASWDYNLVKNEVENDDGVEILCTEIYIFGDTNICTLQVLVAFLSGFGYFMAGIIDMSIARIYDKSNSLLKDKQREQEQENNTNSYPSNLLIENTMIYNSLSDISTPSMSNPLLLRHDQQNNNDDPNKIHKTSSILSYTKLTFSQEGLVGMLLALAGFIECIATLQEPSHEMLATLLFLISCTLYLLESIVALFGLFLCNKCLHPSEDYPTLYENYRVVYYLDKSGDVLFFIGSIVDLTTSVFWVFTDDIQLYLWSVFSAVLWTVDALLYIMGAIIYERMSSS